jgi:hypothetical protein
MNSPYSLPEPPKFTADDWQRSRESGDYSPLLFEWYKFVSTLCNFFASIRPDSPAVRPLDRIHYAVLIGLLNRCARLMLSNVALSHEGLFGETTAIVDRCIFESCVKVCWLCQNSSADGFARFLADGLKTELELKEKIEKAVGARNGRALEIERRMLRSIAHYVESSGMSVADVEGSKKLPDMAAMIDSLGHDRLTYVVGQRIGSHHIHGTWPSLRMHYLEESADGLLMPRDHDCSTHVNQYVFVPLFVLDAMEHFSRFIFRAQEDVTPMIGLVESVRVEIEKINSEVVGSDFQKVEGV